MQIRYIKLGRKGEWEKSCIEETNTIRLGYHSPHHIDCLNGNWDAVRDYWLQHRKGDKGAATRDVNQIRDFYELKSSDIWITFHKRKMYWCHVSEEVTKLDDGSRTRDVIGSWHCNDKNGEPLTIENIDGRITKVQGFRGTICAVSMPAYLVRKINGDIQPDVEDAKSSLAELRRNVATLVEGLWWNDFELLIDLIFSKSGWQRISVLGKTEKYIDLDVFSPVTQKRAFVQVKSSTNADELRRYYESFEQHTQFDEMYFVFHSFKGDLSAITIDDPKLHLWGLTQVSELVIHAGLIDWLITKRS